MRNGILIRMTLMLGAYIGLRYFGGEWGAKALYPIQMLVTYLHEFGHALGALITGGSVHKIQINQNGSGFTQTAGGSRAIILMGGYLGSAIFGNIIFFIGARAKPLVKPLMILIALSMIGTGIFWYNSGFTSMFLIGFAAILLLIALKTDFGREVLMFLGLACIAYIIQDFNVGPSSDLEKYAELLKIFPPNVWMYIWLVLAIILFAINIKVLLSTTSNDETGSTSDYSDDNDDYLNMDAIT